MLHTAVGFVLGAFGELPDSCYSHYTAIARMDTTNVVSYWEMPSKHALAALCKQKVLRF